MRAISIFFIFIITSKYSLAQDEYWSILQFKKNISSDNSIFAEYIRRDKDTFGDNNNLVLTRASLTGHYESWNYLIGASYVDFNLGNDERRLHQFFTKDFKISNSFTTVVRSGFEERFFINDDSIYWRYRLRAQINYLTTEQFGLSSYDEMIFSLNGEKRFYQGLSENRLGLGLSLKLKSVQFYLFNVFANLKNLTTESNPRWLQMQAIFNL